MAAVVSLEISCSHLPRVGVQVGGLETRADIGGELLFPAALQLRLDRHCLDGLDTGDAFDQEGLVLRPANKAFLHPAAQQRRYQQRESDKAGNGQQDNAGQLYAVHAMTARKTNVKSVSMTSVSAEPVMKSLMLSSSRTRATLSPTRRAPK